MLHLSVFAFVLLVTKHISFLQDVCPSDGGTGRRDRPLADCNERTQVSVGDFGSEHDSTLE